MNSICWGILGCGDVTEKKSGPAFSKVAHSSLVAVMRRQADMAEDYARRHNVPRWYDNAEGLISDPDVNAIYIATPPGSHEELALKVARAGKACYVEKPMARTSEECARMVAAFEQADLPLFVAYYRRALPHFCRVKAIIDSGELGALRQLRYDYANGAQRSPQIPQNWRFQPEISGGGLFWDLGCHALDLFDYWLGPLENVNGLLRNLSGRSQLEEVAVCTGLFSGRIPFSGSWNFISSQPEDLIRLEFDRGRIECSCFGPAELRILHESEREETEVFDLPENIQAPLIANIVASLRHEQHPLSTGTSGLRTNQVLDRIASQQKNP